MSPHHSSQSRSHSRENSSEFTSNPFSRRSKSDSELPDGRFHVSSSTSNIIAGSLTAGGGTLEYDMTQLDDNAKPNPYSYYEIKIKQCDNGRGDLDSSRKHNNSEMHFWSYPNISQNYSSNERLCNSSNGGVKRYNAPKHSSFNGVPFYYGLGGRGYGRPSCWNRRKVCFFAATNKILTRNYYIQV